MGGRAWWVIDWQERLVPAMPEVVRVDALKAATNAVWYAETLGEPVWTSEQYPQGLGPTVQALAGRRTFAKTHFSCLDDPAMCAAFEDLAPSHVLLVGMEAHICVASTALGLAARGVEVTVLSDAVLSRRKADWRCALDHLRAQGIEVLPSETVLLRDLKVAAGPVFKELSRRIR